MRIAAAWSWRLLVIVGAVAVVAYGVAYLSPITIPIAVATLLAALLVPARRRLMARGWRNTPASVTVFLGGLVLVTGLITVVVRQLISGAGDVGTQVSGGLDTLQHWLVNGPFKLSQQQIDAAIAAAKKAVSDNQSALTSGALTTASTVGHILTGLVLSLFILYFFLSDGAGIWNWLVGLAPARARARIHGAGVRAFVTLSGYVRATVLVAAVDAVGIGLGLVILGVPLAIPLTALVFLASFIPIVGAVLSGAVAVLVALVTVGWFKALIVVGVVIAVQQLESHFLQPVLLGKAVSLHPLAVALSIGCGVVIGGIVGALLAVPVAAVANTVVKYLVGKEAAPGIEEKAALLTSPPVAGSSRRNRATPDPKRRRRAE